MSAKKSKATRHGAARIEAIRPRAAQQSAWPIPTIRVLALLGLSVGLYLSFLHYQAAGGPIDALFCSVGSTINCNAVLGSAYARLFGIPVAYWASGAYAAVLVFSLLAWTRLVIFLCLWIFIFSAYMAGISLLKLHAVCLFCMSLYAINTGIVIGAIALGRTSPIVTKPQVAIGLTSLAAIMVGISLWQIKAVATTPPLQDFVAPYPQQMEMSFVRYYHEQPAVLLRGAQRHTEGPADARLTIHEFVDFRCPMCAQARATLSRLQQANPDDVRIVFRHYPLDQTCNSAMNHQVHPGACEASIAAECAGEQDKFWQYADALFADQKKHTRQDFETYAEQLGLDLDRFNTCLDDGRMQSRVKDDIEEAERINVKATPTLIVNGRLIEGLPPPKKLATLVTLQKQQAKQ